MSAERVNTSITMRKDIKKASEKAVKDCAFTGVASMGYLIDLALVELLKTKGIKVEAN